ncbi:MAG: rhodanese-like domain-containing protein [Bacilli bacterium]|nr:rhodanese-like domain-containing protein [Bacilli bacterium]
MIREIDTYQLIKLIEKEPINLIDIRDNYKFSEGSIFSARSIPSNFLLTNPDDYLEREETYYIFCNYGTTSKRVCEILAKRGYHVVNIIGGYTSYLEDSK